MSFADSLANADRAARDVLGETVTYTPGVGSPVDVHGIFDELYVKVDAGQISGVSSSGPAVFLTLDDLPSNPKADKSATLTIRTVVYKPYEVHPDGQGGVVCLLHKVT